MAAEQNSSEEDQAKLETSSDDRSRVLQVIRC